jgi:bifunctional phosphoserine phosphatase/homoserine phosphotransferase
MNIVCLDLEGVLVPEIWIAFSKASGIPELSKTTRDEPDYDKLMRWRLSVLKEHNLGLKEIQEIIEKIEPLDGAKAFLDELRSLTQVIIISDTFTQFGLPLMKKLGYPTLFCNELVVAKNGEITFTAEGARRAKEIYERHNVITAVLMRIGADKQTAEDNACRIEHVITDELMQVLKNYFNK